MTTPNSQIEILKIDPLTIFSMGQNVQVTNITYTENGKNKSARFHYHDWNLQSTMVELRRIRSRIKKAPPIVNLRKLM